MKKWLKQNSKDLAQIILIWVVFIAITGAILGYAKAYASEWKGETEVSTAWCESKGGIPEARLVDKSRIDCLLPEYAVEHDWAKQTKPYECIGQALYYGHMTNRKPMCVIIMKEPKDFLLATQRAIVAAGNDVKVECITQDLVELHCWNGEPKQ